MVSSVIRGRGESFNLLVELSRSRLRVVVGIESFRDDFGGTNDRRWIWSASTQASPSHEKGCSLSLLGSSDTAETPKTSVAAAAKENRMDRDMTTADAPKG